MSVGRKAIDLTGKTFGRLTVLGRSPRKARHAIWTCDCQCGQRSEVEGQDLRDGVSQSCGCLSTDLSSQRCKARHQARQNHTQTAA
jgi:hypothetical protein